MQGVTMGQVRKLVGKQVYAVHKDGAVISGKLIRTRSGKLFVKPGGKGKAQTKAILPLVLFDLLAIGAAPYGYGYGGGYGGGYYGPYGGGVYPYGGGGFWF
ncbi:hypothetical protein BG53_11325 [Paenibacillus darwinianus]|uniref:50S ribosomal protein L33 n=1 Tax=Paenibacillus darwinianus TaxID=1380763 RepID=A0A9W5S3A5_9BACL|nr:hypothetical protein [Paenibacillus darwinianus]EXX90768.1 hypothetical protein BG52_12140 [Paenibacillus darwinianus]EXX91417.1 hypothetical protein BG53_11325 [Paenibacillus darwinianus]EXX92171.1 hypothetical protein CH50_11830 [Paenibacillus darwinianus]